MSRHRLVESALLAVIIVGVIACAALVGSGGRKPDEFAACASPQARELVARALTDLPAAESVDMHAHVAGSAADGSGCELSDDMHSWLHPWRMLQYSVYTRAAGVEDIRHGAEQMVARLASVTRGKTCVLALDHRYGADGTLDRKGTAMYVPNDYVLELCRKSPELFLAGVSIHPYRRDALLELERCAARGARIVKWLPNSMGIDPASPLCDPFYERMRSLGMTLLTHAGEEHALAEGDAEFGNPLRLRRALEHGMRVIVAHCGSLGDAQDLDDPGHGRVACFDLFLRLMEEPRYRGLIYGDISAITFRNRDVRVVRTLLERKELHEWLVDGTDWPLPAIDFLTTTGRFERAGLLTKSECEALDEVFRYDPRLFDLTLKRTLKGPAGEKFPASVFLRRREILP